MIMYVGKKSKQSREAKEKRKRCSSGVALEQEANRTQKSTNDAQSRSHKRLPPKRSTSTYKHVSA
jgi:hypothetical protein